MKHRPIVKPSRTRGRTGSRDAANGGAFTLIDTLLVVVILGILAALVLPRYADATDRARETAVASQLHTIRKQIEAYNVAHPGNPFDPLNPGGPAAWDQLLTNGYISSPPKNALHFNLATVAGAPGFGVAWVWADLGAGLDLFAVDEDGAYFDMDGDGTPD